LSLGHSTYAIATVLFALLLTAGLGSLVAHWFGKDPVKRVRRAAWFAALCCIAYAWILDWVFVACAGLPFAARIGLSIALITPPGVALGIPFPTAVHGVSGRESTFVPWALGINGFASVVGSLLCLPLAMLLGLRMSLILGALCYLLPPLLIRTLLPRQKARYEDGILPGTYLAYLEQRTDGSAEPP
jgi:hypothetical protein